ncbi:acyl-CoA dehydrogenase family protein [Rhabdothermincola sp.]|uniref:acyl-CoA dehydrogenase family protein n=1 Tax=Rhabdothermincola sp. TaxID=2820405 RepID=UPI002FDFD227
MEFTFSAEQDQLRDAVRSFLAAESPPSYVRSMMEQERGFTDQVWSQLVDLGWTGVLVPEAQGGLGLGMVDLVVLMEEMGRVVFPGPFFSSAVLATLAAKQLGLEDRLASLASGATRGTVALDEQGHGDVVDRVRTRASRKTGRWLLNGTKPVVLDGHTADWVLVVARTQQGIGTFLVEAPRAELVPTWDLTRKVARLELRDTPAEPVGPDGDHTSLWRRVVDDACVALCAELVGSMEAAQDLAVEYAKARVQFDRPIATFQVIKHKTVDMLHRIELSRVGTHFAAWASDVEDPVRAEAAAMAKAYVPESANEVAGECIQIHGGVGFTWDCDAHLHYRRAKQNDLLFGYHGIHRERVADLVLNPA